jgi:DNA-binding CsgD family transcriptional regulator
MASNEMRKRQFIESTFQMLGSTLRASRLAFYSVDAEYNLYDFTCARVPNDLYRLYIREMYQIDPLHVRRIASRPDGVVRMNQAPDYMPADELLEYTRFMRRYDIIDNIDLIFRVDDSVKAGLSVMWTSHDRVPADEIFQLADDLQRYIEFNLFDHLGDSRADLAVRAVKEFHLTPRETDVAKLLCIGRTNADIAECLGIGVATVKTHLIHIFDKTGVENRSGLVARLSALS